MPASIEGISNIGLGGAAPVSALTGHH